ncbi:hypothetical protein K438DRAFT_2068027 [Mycena galopus ATCC 62051]|nr:hypothetical protein K438DRAFT_2068027 [Mycena galopus ATCC 62051]
MQWITNSTALRSSLDLKEQLPARMLHPYNARTANQGIPSDHSGGSSDSSMLGAEWMARKQHTKLFLNPPFDSQSTRDHFYGTANNRTTEADMQLVRSWLPGAMGKLRVLQTDITIHETRLREARIDLLIAVDLVKEHSSIISAKRRIPVETMSIIMEEALSSISRPQHRDQALVMAHVCRSWRHIAHGNFRLWNFIDISAPNPWSTVTKRQRDGARMEILRATVLRIGNSPVDVRIDADDQPASSLLDGAIALSNRWRYLEIKRYELFEARRGTDDEPILLAMERIAGNVGALRALRLTGSARSHWGPEDEAEGADRTLNWFQYANRLRHLTVRFVDSPETHLVLPWHLLREYHEEAVFRPGCMPLSFLASMSTLVSLHLCDGPIPSSTEGTVVMLHLRTFELELSSSSFQPSASNLLGPFVFPALQNLTVRGHRFRAEGNHGHTGVVDCIFQLLDRSHSPGLSSLTISLSTGLTDNQPWRLMTDIPSLNRLFVEQGFSEDGILTFETMTMLTDKPAFVEYLTIEGGQGPHRAWEMNTAWGNTLITMLEYQLAHNVRTVDVRPGMGGGYNLDRDVELRLINLKERWQDRNIMVRNTVTDGWPGERRFKAEWWDCRAL